MLLLALCLATSAPATASADGGVVRLKGDAGPFTLTLFSAEPLASGPADLSVLVQRRESGEVVLNIDVDLELTRPDGSTLRAEASRRQATNKLLHAASVDLNQTGTWQIGVQVHKLSDTGEIRGTLQVAPATPLAATIWPLLALPAGGVALFLAAQGLRRRRAAQ